MAIPQQIAPLVTAPLASHPEPQEPRNRLRVMAQSSGIIQQVIENLKVTRCGYVELFGDRYVFGTYISEPVAFESQDPTLARTQFAHRSMVPSTPDNPLVPAVPIQRC